MDSKNNIALDAEMALFGYILKHPDHINDAALLLNGDDFSNICHQRIFTAMLKINMEGKSIDTASIIDHIVDEHHSDSEKIKNYLSHIVASMPEKENFNGWISIVRKQSKKRQVKALAERMLKGADETSGETPEALSAEFSNKMTAIMKDHNTSGPMSLRDSIMGLYTNLCDLTGPDRLEYLGIPTGFRDLDAMISGLNKSDLILIGARPAMGKTAFVLNLALNMAAKNKKKVLFFSLEMSNLQLTQRIMSSLTRIPGVGFRNGDLSSSQWAMFNSVAEAYADIPLIIDDSPNTTPEQVKAKIKKLGDVDIVIIDYLSLMKLGYKAENRVQEVSEITRELKLIAKELNIPIVVLSQLNRAVEARTNADHKPQLADLRESGSIEQDADIVIMLYRKDYYKDPDYEPVIIDGVEVQVAELLVRKNRHGPIGDIKVAFIPEFTKFDDLPEEMEEK